MPRTYDATQRIEQPLGAAAAPLLPRARALRSLHAGQTTTRWPADADRLSASRTGSSPCGSREQPDALGANPINEVEHFTGQWALRFLLLTLAVSPVRKLTGWGEAAKYRRMLGLFAFFYATVHLSTWVGVDMELDASDMWHDVVKHKYITIGMAAWLMLLPLAVTSTKGWIRRLGGQRWRRLHTLTYVAATFGVVHYFWAVKKDISQPLLFAAILGALLGYRAWTARRKGERVRDARQRQ